jgi:hypothetical protein
MKTLYIVISLLLFLSGCSTKDVKPWEKGELAKDIMKPNGGNTLVTKFTNHIYFSKEATKGGSGVAGGGCGCN